MGHEIDPQTMREAVRQLTTLGKAADFDPSTMLRATLDYKFTVDVSAENGAAQVYNFFASTPASVSIGSTRFDVSNGLAEELMGMALGHQLALVQGAGAGADISDLMNVLGQAYVEFGIANKLRDSCRGFDCLSGVPGVITDGVATAANGPVQRDGGFRFLPQLPVIKPGRKVSYKATLDADGYTTTTDYDLWGRIDCLLISRQGSGFSPS